MKKCGAYQMRIPVADLLDHPDAQLSRDILSPSGAIVLVPGNVPIAKISRGIDDPQRIIRALENIGLNSVDIVVPHRLDRRELDARIEEIQPPLTSPDKRVLRRAESFFEKLYRDATIYQRFSIPRSTVEDIARALSNEVVKISQIALALISAGQEAYSQNHAINVSLLAGYLALKLSESDRVPRNLIEKAVLAGLLFDVGKLAIPREIAGKDGKLDDAEHAIMRGHVLQSASICKTSGIGDKELLAGILTHHEKFNGSGYPRGLLGPQIPLLGRILSVADTFDAMTSDRVYRNAVSAKNAFDHIMNASDSEFDPDICRVFIFGMGIYPPGSIVQLSDDRVATVVAMTPGNLLQPKVAVENGDALAIVDLAEGGLYIKRSVDGLPRSALDFSGKR